MMDVLSKCESSSILKIYWTNGLIIEGTIDTISETNNCLDETDINYKEYYMCVVKIINILQLPYNELFNEKEGNLIEISILNEPILIKEKDNGVIWEKSSGTRSVC